MLGRTPVLSLLACGLALVACSGEAGSTPGSATTGDDANLTSATAARLQIPLEVLRAAFFVKPSPIDQSGLGVVLADGIAFADGATSEALPAITTLDGAAFAKLPTSTITVGDERYGVMLDYDSATSDPGARLVGVAAPPLLDAAEVTAGKSCRVVGTDMDMYASGPPKLRAMAGTVDRVRDGLALIETTESTGGDMSLLVCDGKLAGISAGSGSQGTWHEYHVLDAKTLDAFTKKRDTCVTTHRCR